MWSFKRILGQTAKYKFPLEPWNAVETPHVNKDGNVSQVFFRVTSALCLNKLGYTLTSFALENDLLKTC